MYPYPLPQIGTEDNIVIYGTGEIGKQYYQQIEEIYNADRIAFFLDSNPKKGKKFNKAIRKPETLLKQEMQNSVFLIASIAAEKEIKQSLLERGVSSTKIIEPIHPKYYAKYLSNERIETLIFYPTINNSYELQKLINKISWYIPSVFENASTISIYLTKDVMIDPLIREKINELDIMLKIDEEIVCSEDDTILLWKQDASEDKLLGMSNANIYSIDKEFYSDMESHNWSRVFFNTLTEESKQEYRKKSIKALESLIQQSSHFSKSTIFGTGPSIDESYSFDFTESFNIICNSIVKNEKLLSHIQPKIIVFADPVFHFGHSKYSFEFRSHLVSAIKKYDCYCVLPEELVPLFSYHYPGIKDRLIGMPIINSTTFNFPSKEDFWVKATANISTLFLLPLASRFSSEIYMIGFDGREIGESYFWKHSSEVQYDDLMKTVFDAHPSFFRDRMYEDYYEEHCSTIENFIRHGEEKGKFYSSLTFSHIQCLKDRSESLF